MLKILPEPFVGKYYGALPSDMLRSGDISGGKNIRKVGVSGGWKTRKGCALLNTIAVEGGAEIKSIHQYTNPKQADYHLITQVNNVLLDAGVSTFYLLTEDDAVLIQENNEALLGEASADPLAQSTTLGTTLGVTTGDTPGFSCRVGEDFCYADGSSAPVIWGGSSPYCRGFYVWDNSESSLLEYSSVVTDSRNDTFVTLGTDANDYYYVISSERAEAISLVFGTNVNTNAVTPTVYAWRAGSWADVGASDSTATTQTHDTSGELTWVASALDEMRILGTVMGYVYKVTFSGAPTAIDIISCKVRRPASTITNKWDGVFEYLNGAIFYDQSVGLFKDVLGAVSETATSTYLDLNAATTSDYIYIKTIEPATAFGFGITTGEENTNNAQIDQIDIYEASGWTAVTTNLVDTTLDEGADSSFATTGVLSFDASAYTPQKRTFQGDSDPGYWYRISWDAQLSATTKVNTIVYASYPTPLPSYAGCTEFMGRLFVWGDPTYPNRLRYSVQGFPDIFVGEESGYTGPFGGEMPILFAETFGQFLLVWKRRGVYLMTQDGTIYRITTEVGLASPKTVKILEVGSTELKQEEVVRVAIWQAQDGVYLTNGETVRKISSPVGHYFNPESSFAIPAADIQNRQAFIDRNNDEYHLLLDDVELVYNFKLEEWYPPWERELIAKCGISLTGSDGRFYSYYGTAAGFVILTETDTSDKDSSNDDVAIASELLTRTILAPEGAYFEFVFRKLWLILKPIVATGHSLTTTFYKDGVITGTVCATPTAISLSSATHLLLFPVLDETVARCVSFQLKFATDTVDREFEFHQLVYQLEIQGIIQ